MLNSKKLSRFVSDKKDAIFRELVSIADSFTKLAKEVLPSDIELNKLILNDPELAQYDQVVRIADMLDKISKTDLKGDKGDTGEQGEAGIDGVDGRDGESITGPQGPQGVPGVDGKNGKDGKIGPKGDKGDAGLNGYNGTDGKDGKDGKDGANGLDGSQDTPDQIRAKLLQLKENEKFVDMDTLARATSILDSRTSFLINKINNVSGLSANGTSLILTAPDGGRWDFSVNNDGELITTKL